ncbi:hypothetical protein F5X98DRAFT_351623 [Xylaria grammica]|nr:hypothetical protein F5X98DRAFT_351623 [Xylaria grammica]
MATHEKRGYLALLAEMARPILFCSSFPLSFWLQWAHAYGVRLGSLWSVICLFLLAYRHITKSTVYFVVDLYTTTFWASLGLFCLLSFPQFTVTFIGLTMILTSLVRFYD